MFIFDLISFTLLVILLLINELNLIIIYYYEIQYIMSKSERNYGERHSRASLKNNFFNVSFRLGVLPLATRRETVIQREIGRLEDIFEDKSKASPTFDKKALNMGSLIFATYPGQTTVKKHNKNYLKILNDLKKLLPIFNSNKKLEQFSSQKSKATIDINKTCIIEIALEESNVKFNISEIHQLFNKPPEERTFEDLLKLIKYLASTKFCRYFLKENLTKESVDKMLVFCGSEMQIKDYPKKTEVFKIGDLPDNFYLIFGGEVEILKPVQYQVHMNGGEYFYYLMKLRKQKETYIYNLTINENQSAFPVKSTDINNLHWIYINIMLNLIYSGTVINFEEVLNICDVTGEQIGIKMSDESQHLITYILQNRELINHNIPGFHPDKLHYYSYFQGNIIQENSKKKQVNLYELKTFLTLEEGAHFGDMALDSKTTRNATIRTKTETSLLYIDAKLYEENLAKEKQVIAIKEISFLQQSFFFADINLQTFEKKYFNYFIIEDKLQGEVLCSENDVINEIYFIRKGIISLYSTKSPIEIHNFLYTLAKNNPNHQSHRGIQYSPLKTNIRELKKELLTKRSQKLFDINNCEIIGLESFFFDLPCFVTAVVKSKNARVIKLSVEHLKKIFSEDNRSFRKAKIFTNEKIDMWYKRFLNINNTNLTTIDNRKFYIEKERKSQIEEDYQKKERLRLIQQRNYEQDHNERKRKRYEKNNSVLIPTKRIMLDTTKLKLMSTLNEIKSKDKEMRNKAYLKLQQGINKSNSYDGTSTFFLAEKRKYLPERFDYPKKQETNQIISTVFENQILQKLRETTNNIKLVPETDKIQEETLSKSTSMNGIVKSILKNENKKKATMNNYDNDFNKGNVPIPGKNKRTGSHEVKKKLFHKGPYISQETKEKLEHFGIFNHIHAKMKQNDKVNGDILEHELGFNVTSSLPKCLNESIERRKKLQNCIFKKQQNYIKYKKGISNKLNYDFFDKQNENNYSKS